MFPFIIWGNTYIVGGDDTRLYYVFPLQFLKNYTFNIISDNTLAGAMTGYGSVSYFAPVFFTIAIFKFIPLISTQMLLYGLNLSIGFYAFYKLISLWIEPKSNRQYFGNILASIFYITSIYLVKTVYTNQLLSIYLVSIIPLTIYLFLKGIRKNSISLVMLSVLVFSLFSSTINTIPWSAAMLIVITPFLLYELLLNFKKFLVYGSLFLILFLLLNFYWIFPLIFPYFHNTGLQNVLTYYSSSNFIKDNIRIITGVSGLYTPINIPFNQMDTMLLNDITIGSVTQSIFFITIITAIFFVIRRKTTYSSLYFISLLSFLLSWFLFSPNIGSYGTIIFLYFSNHIPFFTMFRNMFDKFALPLALTYSLCFAFSLQVIIEKINSKYMLQIVFCFLLIILLWTSCSNMLYLRSQLNDRTKFSGEFNIDFMNMVNYLQGLDNASRIAWIPLNSPTYTSIEDANYPGHFYSGLSPLRELANMSDYAGRFSFITQTDLFTGDKLFTDITDGKYIQAGQLLQQRNTKYFIIDHQLPPEYLRSFYFGGSNMPLLADQGTAFQKRILGSKIKDFGTRYTIYNINNQFENDKLFLTPQANSFPKKFKNLSYTKLSSYSYQIVVKNLIKSEYLIFLDPYYKDWVLNIQNDHGSTEPYNPGKNKVVFGYANEWLINPMNIKKRFGTGYYTQNSDGSINFKFILYFELQKYTIYSELVSIATFIGVLCYFIFLMIRITLKKI